MNSRQFAIIYFVFCLNCACFGEDSSPNDIRRRVVCIWETFDADCGQNNVVLIVEALLGRMRNGSGCSIDLGSAELPCFADIRLFAERKCAGRRRCSFKPIDDNLQLVPGNCSRRVEKFMLVTYRCQAVYSADSETCLTNRSLVVTSSSGYLSNTVTEELGKGSSLCPWRFQPGEGQTVTLTLLDFGVWQDRGERSRPYTCRIYARIRHLQPNSFADIPICAGDERESHVQSTATAIEVLMTTQGNQSPADKAYFLIRFQTSFSSLSTSSSHTEFSTTEFESSVEPLKEELSSISWTKYFVIGGLLSVAVIVLIIVAVMCRNRRVDRKRKSERVVTPFADNMYYSGQLLTGGGLYEEIPDNNCPRIPEHSSSGSVPETKVNCALRSGNDPPTGRSPEHRPDALSRRPLPCPQQYTDPLAEDSPYLVPREEEWNVTSSNQ